MASSRDAQVRENFISAELDRQSQRAQFNRTLLADGSGSATLSSAEGGLPKVSGLQLIKSQGGIWAQWSDTNLRDILRYDVWVGTDEVFSTGDTGPDGNEVGQYRTRDNQFSLADLDPAVTYYVAVRVVNAAGQTGAFSNTLNTTTGLITTTSINPGDVTEFVDDTDITWTALTANNNTETDTSDYTSAVVGSINETIQYQGFFEFEYESTYGNAANDNLLRFQLFRRADGATTEGTQIGDDIDLDFHSSIPTLGTGNVSATTFVVFPKDNPGLGTFEYALKVSAVSGHTLNFMNFQGTKLTVQIRNDKV